MVNWARMPSKMPNRCVFIFQSPTLEELKTVMERNELTVLSNFLSAKQGQDYNIIRVSGTDASEVLNTMASFIFRLTFYEEC
ncbi:MAG: hypothetical protein GY749_03405 [Desulfobacteraceae bacterium]|nr:hypothetical protein [Desulfobacteraceae bacterium]